MAYMKPFLELTIRPKLSPLNQRLSMAYEKIYDFKSELFKL
jgi:hypothetical protein